MDKKRLFRLLVCFLLICSFLINVSPIRIRVEATVVDPISVGAAAVLMWFIGTYMGVVFNPTASNLNSLWNTIQVDVPPAIYSYYDDEEAAVAALDDWQRAIYNFDFSQYDDDDSSDNESGESDPGEGSEESFDQEASKWGFGFNKSNTITIGAELGAFLVDYFANIAEQGGFEAFTSGAPEGYAYYNGFLLPDLPSGGSHVYVFSSSDGFVWLSSPNSLSYYSDGSVKFSGYKDVQISWLSDDGLSWENQKTQSVYSFSTSTYVPIYTNSTIYHSGSSAVYLESSSPTSYATAYMEPAMYFGAYYDEILNETFDSKSVKIPTLDFSQLMETSAYAQEAAMSMYNQIYNGQMSYNDFVEQIQADNAVVDPGGTPVDPSPNLPGPADPSAPLPSPPPALGDYSLDLRDFFPFCIPYDIYALLSLLAAEPEAPYFEFDVDIPIIDFTWHIVIDLSPWDDVAAVLRTMELLLFIVGLGVATRNYYIRG